MLLHKFSISFFPDNVVTFYYSQDNRTHITAPHHLLPATTNVIIRIMLISSLRAATRLTIRLAIRGTRTTTRQ